MRPLPAEPPREEFHRSVTAMIARADRALSVAEAIADIVGPLNAPRYRDLFHQILLAEVDEVVLCLAKLFDPPPKGYPTRSITSILIDLEKHAASRSIFDRTTVVTFLSAAGYGSEELGAMSDEELTHAFVKGYRAHLKSLAAELGRIRFRRDKEVAHNEAVDPTLQTRALWTDLTQLLNEAKSFAGMVGPAYLDFHFMAADGSYMLTRQHTDVGREMRQLLASLNLSG